MVTGGFVSSIDVVIFLVHRYPTFLVLDFLYIFFFCLFLIYGLVYDGLWTCISSRQFVHSGVARYLHRL